MSTGTTLVPFKRALVAALATRLRLMPVQVTYEYPDDITGRDIWLGRAESDNRIPVSRAGTMKVDEEYTLVVIAQALETTGGGQEAADVDAVVMLAAVQQELAENPQTTPEIQWARVTGWDQSTGPFGEADGGNANRGSRFEIRVTVKARLFP